jgi:hypothetical protein
MSEWVPSFLDSSFAEYAGLVAVFVLIWAWSRFPRRVVLGLFGVVLSGVGLYRWRAPFMLLFALLAAGGVLGWVLSRVPRRTLWSLAAIVLVGAALRWWFAPPTLMDVYNYEREPILFRWFAEAGMPLQVLFPAGWDRWQQILALDFAVSCLLPIVVFAHAQVCFSNPRLSIFAAALFAVCPIPIYFARSDNLYITSALMSSMTFVVLHAAMSAESETAEVLLGLGALALFAPTLEARQENFLFGGLILAPVALKLASEEKGRWRKVMWGAFLFALAVRWYWTLAQAKAGGSSASVSAIAQLVFDVWTDEPFKVLLWTNNYLAKPWLLPLPITLLALAGMWWTWRQRRRAFFYIAWWFAVFYVGHGILPAWDDTATVRYGMHTIIPVLFAASFGLDWFLQYLKEAPPSWRSPAAMAGLLVFVTLTGWWGCGLFRQGESDVQQEYRFLRELAERGIPEAGALVIESYGNYQNYWRDGDFGAARTSNRFEYFGVKNVDGHNEQAIKSARTFVPGHEGPMYLYTGLPCLWLRRGAENSRACAAALSWAKWEKMASRQIVDRAHDSTNGDWATGGEITLWRLAGPAPDVPPEPITLPASQGQRELRGATH